eukprot:TRINITY_DN2971_c0_g2_i19.p1 TRINITY_DN2971_c0_g2~~TRINITY_DN2971_c0_g2_i19.p1  ORF type:complete len:289 (+),score=76.37 TRINITY_DN2971_c0_g2_i19:131-997(+)
MGKVCNLMGKKSKKEKKEKKSKKKERREGSRSISRKRSRSRSRSQERADRSKRATSRKTFRIDDALLRPMRDENYNDYLNRRRKFREENADKSTFWDFSSDEEYPREIEDLKAFERRRGEMLAEFRKVQEEEVRHKVEEEKQYKKTILAQELQVSDSFSKSSKEEGQERSKSEEPTPADPAKPTFIGPRPLNVAGPVKVNYGDGLLFREGDKMAEYVKSGKRIPRRGEVGLSADDIERYESLGYVMSGSRHKRMNAVRLRKEGQVYSAEEKRALAVFNYEQKLSLIHI